MGVYLRGGSPKDLDDQRSFFGGCQGKLIDRTSRISKLGLSSLSGVEQWKVGLPVSSAQPVLQF